MSEPLQLEQALALLQEAIALTHQLLEALPEHLAEYPDQVYQQATRREQVIEQLFHYPWCEEEVQLHQALFIQLERLDQAWVKAGAALRESLHQQRVDNQHKRKAVHAYGQAKGQFLR